MKVEGKFQLCGFWNQRGKDCPPGYEKKTTYQKPAFDGLKANTFVLVYIIESVRLKKNYAYEIAEVGGKDLEVTGAQDCPFC